MNNHNNLTKYILLIVLIILSILFIILSKILFIISIILFIIILIPYIIGYYYSILINDILNNYDIIDNISNELLIVLKKIQLINLGRSITSILPNLFNEKDIKTKLSIKEMKKRIFITMSNTIINLININNDINIQNNEIIKYDNINNNDDDVILIKELLKMREDILKITSSNINNIIMVIINNSSKRNVNGFFLFLYYYHSLKQVIDRYILLFIIENLLIIILI
jgi:hypothetical protein